MAQVLLTSSSHFAQVQHVIDKYGDPRLQDWFLMRNPTTLLVILAIYFYFCTTAGPRIMKNRKPFQLKELMVVYNAFCVAVNVWLSYEALMSGWLTSYNYTCQPIDFSNSPEGLRMVRVCYWFFISKIIELLDTVFFILRKKNNQITFLHLYHHTHVPLLTWATARFSAGGQSSMAGMLNAMVHVVMYTYYLLAALGPRFQKFLWWKKYVTTIQLIQFVLTVIHQGQIFFNGCNIPKYLPLFNMLNSAFFLYLFGSFYLQTYLKKKPKDHRSVE